ncbi:hypothetical protein FB451DRAFT_1429335 [Mycena latifolia]|nr:hypothetical protein FB451DRAFT_1429335 [Mycena latifolia]
MPFSNITDGIHLGLMFFLALSVAWELEPFNTILLCGLCLHSGTLPTYSPKKATVIPSHILHCLMIAYMLASIFDGKRICTPKQHASHDRPQAACAILPENTLDSTQATYAANGSSLMDLLSHTTFIRCKLLHLIDMVLHEMPEYIGARIDCDAFLCCI